jgi:hypothetical protein
MFSIVGLGRNIFLLEPLLSSRNGSSLVVGGGQLTNMPTLPPRRNTLPGKVSPWPFDTSAFNLTKPSRPPPKRSTDWILILRRTYGSLWNSCEGCSCRARDCWRVVIQILKAGNESRSSWLRSGMLFTWRFELGTVNVDMAFVLALMVMVGLRVGVGCVSFRCRAARRREFINSG